MPTLNLKPTHKALTEYYAGLDEPAQLDLFGEGAVAPTFAALLRLLLGYTQVFALSGGTASCGAMAF